jgi:hypothetical protein
MLQRFSNTIPDLTVAVAVADSEEISFGSYSGGFIFTESDSGITTITWYVAEKPGGTYLVAYDEDSVAITQTVTTSRAYAIPSALFGARAVKAVASAGTADTVMVCLKG